MNAVALGSINTERYETLLDQQDGDRQRITQEMARLHPLGRVGRAGEVAAAVAYLLSDEASFISGAVCPSTVDVRFKARTPKSARHRLTSRPRRRTLRM